MSDLPQGWATFHTKAWKWRKRWAFARCILLGKPVRVSGDVCHCDTTTDENCTSCRHLRGLAWKDIPV